MKLRKIIALAVIGCMVVSMTPKNSFAYGQYDDFSEYKSKYRILYGILLIVGGGILAYDGFRTVKTDISKPSANINFSGQWNHTSYPGQIKFQSDGTITNTGNVKLTGISFEVRYTSLSPQFYYPNGYYDGKPAGVPAKFETNEDLLYALGLNESMGWSNEYVSMKDQSATNDPTGLEGVRYPSYDNPDKQLVEIVNVKYRWEKKYKEEMNNVYEGIAGVLLIGGGVYLLVDYIVSLKRFDYYMKKHNMDMYVENNSDEFKLMFSKRL